MKKISLILCLVFACFLPQAVAQRYRVESGSIECFYNGRWKPIPVGERLGGHLLVRSIDCFEVKDTETNKLYYCASSKKGGKLVELIKKRCQDQKPTDDPYEVAEVPKGKGLSIEVNQQINGNFPVNFHYLLVGIHDFQDSLWPQLPDPIENIYALKEAIENKMIPDNNYQRSVREVITDSKETSRDAILEKLRFLSDSVKFHNNDMVFVYLSSHGSYDDSYPPKYLFITTDSQINADTINAYINKMTAKGAKVLVFVDACQSGAIVNGIRKIDGDGKCGYYMSSAENVESFETGAFVRALINVVSGEALDYVNSFSTNTVTPGRLHDYITHYVTAEKISQNPRFRLYNFEEGEPLWIVKPNLIDSLKDQANKGNYCAMLKLGDIYYYSYHKHGISKDTAKALGYYREAYNCGNPMAACRLGMHYYYQSHTPDYDKAFKLFEESAEKECDLGRYYLSVCYAKGKGVKIDKSKARHYFKIINYWDNDLKKAYWKEHVVFLVSPIYTVHIPSATIKAFKFPTGDTIICNSEDIEAWTNLGFGATLERAYAGDSKCQADLGDRFLYGRDFLIRNYQQAYYWYNESAKQGDKDGLYGMGVLCMNGLGVEKNFQKAADYFRQSGDKGNPKAYTKLGILCYSGGYGLEADTNQAIEQWRKATELNEVEGMYMLGLCYKEGCGLTKDLNKALSLLKKSANKGYVKSLYSIAELLYDTNTRECKKWLRKAINRGDRQALEFYNIKFNDACPSESF